MAAGLLDPQLMAVLAGDPNGERLVAETRAEVVQADPTLARPRPRDGLSVSV